MGIGHFAVGLALKRVEPRVDLGALTLAAYLSDSLLGIFVWLGIEQYHVPSDLAARHYLTFTFPYSHGLMATLLWSLLAAVVAARWHQLKVTQKRAGWLLGMAVLSHFLLDALVHVSGLPILGEASYKFSLGLWNHLTLELLLEAAMVIAGLALYFHATQSRTPLGRYAMIALVVLLTPTMILGQATMVDAPPRGSLIATWVAMPLLLALIAHRLDRHRLPA
jgi:hypothetical protein